MNFFRLSLKQFMIAGTLVVIPGAVAVGIYRQQLWAVSVLIVMILFLAMIIFAAGLASLFWGLAYAKQIAWGIKVPVRSIPNAPPNQNVKNRQLSEITSDLQSNADLKVEQTPGSNQPVMTQDGRQANSGEDSKVLDRSN